MSLSQVEVWAPAACDGQLLLFGAEPGFTSDELGNRPMFRFGQASTLRSSEAAVSPIEPRSSVAVSEAARRVNVLGKPYTREGNPCALREALDS